MGKKRAAIIGSESEEQLKAEKAVKRTQKKLREGKSVDKASVTVSEPAPVEVSVTAESVSAPPTPSAPSAVHKTHHRSSAYKLAKSKVDSAKLYPLSDALNLLRGVNLAKFDPTVELHLTLKTGGVNKEISLPHSTGKSKTIAVATDAVISEIESGKTNFDVLLASPAQMAKLVKFAKTLGPKGLMPNPKSGTVVEDPEKKAKEMAGKITLQLKTEKDTPVIHTFVGKLSMSDQVLTENIKTVLASLPPSQILKVVLKSTISPAIKVAIA